MLIAVNYHYVRPSFDGPHPGIHGVTPDELEKQLQLLRTLGQFVTPAALRAAVAGGRALPPRALIVTFDDGLREQYEHALPVLQRLGIPALFFINTRPIRETEVSTVHKLHLSRARLAPEEFAKVLEGRARAIGVDARLHPVLPAAVAQYRYDRPEVAQLKYALNFLLSADERDVLVDACFAELFGGNEQAISRALYMTTGQVKALSALDLLGTHGDEHLALGLLAPEEVERCLVASIDSIDRWTGKRPYALSYPYGSRDASAPFVGEIARRHGIELAFTMERAANRDLLEPLLLARFSANDLPGGKDSLIPAAELFARAEARCWHQNPDTRVAS